jgi:hypothetical protein
MATTTTVRISTIAAKTPTSQPSFSSEKEIRQQVLFFRYRERQMIKTISSQSVPNDDIAMESAN